MGGQYLGLMKEEMIMKKTVFLFAAVAALTVSCQKEPVTETVPAAKGIEKTFMVTSPDTRTTLDGMSIKWAADDEINVIAATTGNQYTFTLSGGAGTGSASFTGTLSEDDAEETVFYAVYPNVAIRPASLENDILEVDKSLGATQTAVKNGFDPHFAVMTAVVGEDGKFTFRHGVAYFKITIGNEDVVSVNLKTSGTRFQGRPQIVASTGAYSNIQGAADNITLAPAEGTLECGATYFIPVLCKNSSLKTLTLTYKFSDGTVKSMSTDAKSSVKLELGKIYNLGTPAFIMVPTILAKDPSALEYDATSGSIAYEIVNPVEGQSVTASLEEGVDWISNLEVGENAVTFDCDPNTGDMRSAVITLSYEGAEDVEVTVSQKAAGTVSEDYVWDFSSSEWTAELASKGNANSDITEWVSTVNGLTWTSIAKSKWNTRTIGGVTYTYIQAGGKGTTEDRVFTFTVQNAGKLYVTTTGTSSTADESRMCTVKVGDSDEVSKVGGSSQDMLTVNEFEIEAGDVYVYPTVGALRFFKIEFHSN